MTPMFVLAAEPRWIWPVEIRVPADGGDYAQHQIRCRFRLLSDDERSRLSAQIDGGAALLRAAVVELMDLADASGAPVVHSPELLEAALANPWVRIGLLRSYGAALAGAPGAAAAGN